MVVHLVHVLCALYFDKNQTAFSNKVTANLVLAESTATKLKVFVITLTISHYTIMTAGPAANHYVHRCYHFSFSQSGQFRCYHHA